jgi:hypothetical protein
MYPSRWDGAKNSSVPVITFKVEMDSEDYDGMDWPEPPHEDPLSIIDKVELALAYLGEANCTMGEQSLVEYIHINRLSNTMRIDNLKDRSDEQQAAIRRNEKHIKHLNRKVSLMESSQTELNQTLTEMGEDLQLALTSLTKALTEIALQKTRISVLETIPDNLMKQGFISKEGEN